MRRQLGVALACPDTYPPQSPNPLRLACDDIAMDVRARRHRSGEDLSAIGAGATTGTQTRSGKRHRDRPTHPPPVEFIKSVRAAEPC
jgi:hypothetical protein